LPKKARFSATFTWKMHVFQPLPPEKCTYFGGKCTWFLFLPSLFPIVSYTWTKILIAF
jgi:hypothetical protein